MMISNFQRNLVILVILSILVKNAIFIKENITWARVRFLWKFQCFGTIHRPQYFYTVNLINGFVCIGNRISACKCSSTTHYRTTFLESR